MSTYAQLTREQRYQIKALLDTDVPRGQQFQIWNISMLKIRCCEKINDKSGLKPTKSEKHPIRFFRVPGTENRR